MKQKEIYAFIDSQNLNLGVRSQGWKLDFERFHVFLKDKYKVKKAFLFIGYIKKKNKLRKIIVPNRRYSSLLRKFGSFIVNIGLFKDKLISNK